MNTPTAERIRELREWVDIEIDWAKKNFRKPTHGTCCTCQTCGQSNEGPCLCDRIETLTDLLSILDAHASLQEEVERLKKDYDWMMAQHDAWKACSFEESKRKKTAEAEVETLRKRIDGAKHLLFGEDAKRYEAENKALREELEAARPLLEAALENIDPDMGSCPMGRKELVEKLKSAIAYRKSQERQEEKK